MTGLGHLRQERPHHSDHWSLSTVRRSSCQLTRQLAWLMGMRFLNPSLMSFQRTGTELSVPLLFEVDQPFIIHNVIPYGMGSQTTKRRHFDVIMSK